MTTVAVISEAGATEADATIVGTGVWVPAEIVDDALGWEIKPEGLCRGDVCVPATAALARDSAGRVDLVTVAAALQRPTLLDADAASIVVGASAADRRGALQGKELPSFSLPDLDGRMHHSDEWRGRKVLLSAFASW
jgi:hypothetical protein